MKEKYPYILIIVIILGVFGVACYTAYQAIPRINYASYYAKNREYDIERIKRQEELEGLYQDYEEEKISKEELEQEVKAVREKYSSFQLEREELKKEYKMTDELDLDKVKMARKSDRDISLKNLYYRKTDVEKQEADLDAEAEELEHNHFQGEISTSEFLKQIKDIEIREHLLELEETKLEEDARELGIID